MPKSNPKCACGCGQQSAASMRQRKASCSCGASVIRLSRQAIGTVNASCIACDDPLIPDCLFDRTCSHDESEAAAAVAALESRYDRALARAAPKMGPVGPSKLRCGCGAVRAAHGPCRKCGSTHPPTTSFMHPRAARVVGGDMPF